MLQHLNEEGLRSDHSPCGLGNRSQREPTEPPDEVVVGEGRVLQIGTCLTQENREGLVDFFRRNLEVFTWSHEDMPRISLEVIVHVLNVGFDMKPVK